MLLDAAVVTVIVGVLSGGRLRRLGELDLRAPSLFILAAMVQVGGAILGTRGSQLAVHLGGPLHMVTYLLLLAGLWLNRHRREMLVAGVGVLLNFLVIAANGGSMPVDRDLAVKAGSQTMVRLLDSPTYVNHEPVTPETRLRPLGDVLLLPRPYPRPHVFSIGDVFVTVGGCWLILSALGAFGLGGRAPASEGSSAGGGEPT